MEHETLFPGNLGYREVIAGDALDLPHWADRLMLRFSSGNPKGNQRVLTQVLADKRAFQLNAISLDYELKTTVRQIVASAGNLPNLRAAHFRGPRNWSHYDFLQAFPGIDRLVADDLTMPFQPVRHIGLKYLGLMPDRWGIKSLEGLADSVLPDLEVLSLDLRTVMPLAMPILTAISSGSLFPRLRHLHIQDCRFTNKLVSGIFSGPHPVQLEQLDLMNSPIDNKTAQTIANNASPRFRLTVDHHRIGSRTMSEIHDSLGDRFREGISLRAW